MENVKSALINSLEDVETVPGNSMRPIGFDNFVMGMSAVAISMATGETESDNLDLLNAIKSFVVHDFAGGTVLILRMRKFLNWYLDQPAVFFDEGSDDCWYMGSYIYGKYQQYLKEHGE